MDNPNINSIKAMSPEARAALNAKLQKQIAVHMVGMIFLKLAMGSIARTLATKAIIELAKRA